MAITLNGDTGITAPTTTTTGEIVSATTVADSSAVIRPLVSGTAVTSSGTSVDFTDIPSWVKRITVMFSGVSLSGTWRTMTTGGSSAPTSGNGQFHLWVRIS